MPQLVRVPVAPSVSGQNFHIGSACGRIATDACSLSAIQLRRRWTPPVVAAVSYRSGARAAVPFVASFLGSRSSAFDSVPDVCIEFGGLLPAKSKMNRPRRSNQERVSPGQLGQRAIDLASVVFGLCDDEQ